MLMGAGEMPEKVGRNGEAYLEVADLSHAFAGNGNTGFCAMSPSTYPEANWSV